MEFLRILGAVLVDLHRQPFAERVGHRSANAVQTARETVVVGVELTARVQFREYEFNARNSVFGVNVDRDTSAVIAHAYAVVGVDNDIYAVAETVGDLVDAVVDYLPQDMVHTLAARRTDIHTRSDADSFEPFQHLQVF